MKQQSNETWMVSVILGLALLVNAIVLSSCGVIVKTKGLSGQSGTIPPDDYTQFDPTKPGATLPPLPTSPPTVLPKGARDYFNSVVIPSFNNHCVACHNDPRLPGEGPLTIYSYNTAVNFLMSGTGAEQNQLIYKMRAIVPHPGADRCPPPDGANASPCFEVKNWWAMEAVERGNTGSAGALGSITDLALDGKVYGWAVDAKSVAASIQVEFFVGGPKGTGTLIGSVSANQPSPNLNFQGNHGFTFSIPATYRNRTNYTLYANAVGTDASNANLSGGGKSFLLYQPTTAGQNYYNNTVRPTLNACAGCHPSTDTIYQYETAFYFLVGYPKPNQGGSPTNNNFVNKALGNLNHGGGNLCGNLNGSPCAQLQTWWGMEFN